MEFKPQLDTNMTWLYLTLAIGGEFIGTTTLKLSDGFTKFTPSVISIVSYIFSFYFLSITLRKMSMGIAYAIWSAIGIIMVSGFGYIFYQEKLDIPAKIGITLIIIGVVVINVFSKSSIH